MSKAADDYVSRSVRYSEGGYRGGGGEYGSGWTLFAGLMLGFAGVMNTINGILAISRSKVFADDAAYVFSDLRTWGWIILFLGVLQLLAAFYLATGSELARWAGIGAAGLNAVGQLYFLNAQPWWSLAIFGVDILIIYGLAVYAGKHLNEDL